jgi:ABC-2 type transport system permease protein
VAAIRAGQPVAVFEDPLPVLMQGVPGTAQPRRGPGGPMAMFQPQQQPKGDIGQLWQTLGVKLMARGGRPAMGQVGADPLIVCQDYNPHPKLELPDEFVFIDADLTSDASGKLPGFNARQPITAGLQEVLFPFPGAVVKDDKADVAWTPLAQTGLRTGTIEVEQVMGNRGDMRQLQIFEKQAKQSMVLAVAVERQQAAEAKESGDAGDKEAPPAARPIRAVIVADIDLMDGRIFGLRNRPDEVFGLNFDNVTFVLNILDSLAGDDRFLEIRKRKPKHRTLERIEDTVAAAREKAEAERQKFIAEFDEAERGANDSMQAEVGEFEKKIKEMETAGDADPQAAMQAVQQLPAGSGSRSGVSTPRSSSSSGSGTRRSRRSSANWRRRSARSRTGRSGWPCCCRRFRRSWWPFSSISDAGRWNARAWRSRGCGECFPGGSVPRQRDATRLIKPGECNRVRDR